MQTYESLKISISSIRYICTSISNHLHALQVENCDSNSRLVVHEDDKGKSRP